MHPNRKKLFLQIGTAFLCRLLINTSKRFIYPFAPALSRGMGVPLTAVTAIIAANQFTGILGIIVGPLADRWGYRAMMLTGIGILAAGMLMGGVFPYYFVVLGALFLAGVGKIIFDPAIWSYTARSIPFERRGAAMGLLEMCWAGSSLLGIPLAGVAMAKFGWQAVFWIIGGAAVLCWTALWHLLPKTSGQVLNGSVLDSLKSGWRLLFKSRAAAGALVFAVFFNAANDALFVVYGVWLEEFFGLSLTTLGLTATVIGLAELTGEGVVAVLSDRIGLKRSVIGGAALSGICYLLLPVLSGHLWAALGGLFFLFLCVEFTFVASLSFFTELLPEARATMMAGYLAAASVGRVCGALIGGPVWLSGGIWGIGAAAMGISVLGVGVLVWAVWGWEAASQNR